MSTTGIPVNAQQLDPSPSELCHMSWSCEFAATLSDIWLLLVAWLFVFVVLAALTNLRAAADRIDEERSRTAAERDAFRAFANRISEMSPDRRATTGGAHGAAVASAVAVPEPTRSLSKVRDAYRDTVMAIPHYDEEYSESLAENMAIEFGGTIAASVENGQELSPTLHQVLVSKARAAAADRDRLMGRLKREAEELQAIRSSLAEVQTELEHNDAPKLRAVDLEELAARWDRLDELEDRCTDVVQRRQRTLTDELDVGLSDGPTFLEYLYGPLSVDHPALVDAIAVLDRIEDARRMVSIATTRRA